MESTSRYESLAKKEGKKLDTRCSIAVHSRRKRLTDPDGTSAKAVLDGLRVAGILVDDSAKFVKEVSFSQEVGEPEETRITLTWPNDGEGIHGTDKASKT
jgi:hypothetical protein